MGKRNDWLVIPDFESHEVNSRGEIRHIKSWNILNTSTNQTGVRYAALRNTRTNQYENRALSVLIASAFCPGRSKNTDTVLHRDGDISNVSADNLMWATRYDAIAFHKEVHESRFKEPRTIVDAVGNRYKSIVEVARETGCLPSAIDYAIRYNDNMAQDTHTNFIHRLYPGGHVFRSA